MKRNTEGKLGVWLAVVAALIIMLVGLLLILTREKGALQGSREEKEYVTPSKYEGVQIKTTEEHEDDRRYALHISWPVTENENINRLLDKSAENFIAEYRESVTKIKEAREDYIKETGLDGATFHTHYNSHFDVAFANEDYIAFVFYNYRNTGNTGTEDVLSKIYDRHSGEEILLSRLFAGDNYLEVLSELSREELRERAEKEAAGMSFDSQNERQQWFESIYRMIEQGTEPTAENFHSVVINEEGYLVINFDKYQVAPGYVGVVTVEIPLSKISSKLSPGVRELFDLVEEVSKPTPPPAPPRPPSGGVVNCAVEKCVALTFDDGPSVHTERLLDILAEKEAKATFFVLGVNARVQQSTLRRISDMGMEIGNHSWNHMDFTRLSDVEIRGQINDTANLIETITGVRPWIVRPPYGAFNDHTLSSAGAPLILWNVDPEDWKYQDTELIANHLISNAKPGSILLAHDIYGTTVEAMPAVIDGLRSQGYFFVTVSELVGHDNLAAGRAYRSR